MSFVERSCCFAVYKLPFAGETRLMVCLFAFDHVNPLFHNHTIATHEKSYNHGATSQKKPEVDAVVEEACKRMLMLKKHAFSS